MMTGFTENRVAFTVHCKTANSIQCIFSHPAKCSSYYQIACHFQKLLRFSSPLQFWDLDIGSEEGFNRDKIDINSSRLLSLVRLGVTSCTHKRDVRRLVRPGGTLSLLSLLPAQTPSPSWLPTCVFVYFVGWSFLSPLPLYVSLSLSASPFQSLWFCPSLFLFSFSSFSIRLSHTFTLPHSPLCSFCFSIYITFLISPALFPSAHSDRQGGS